jgi:Glycosyl hydrolases family 6
VIPLSKPSVARQRHHSVLLLLAVALLVAAALPSLAHAGADDPTNPLAGQRQFINCENLSSNGQSWDPWWQVHHARGRAKSLLEKIARVPTTQSFAGTAASKIGRRMERTMANVDHPMVGGSNCSHHLHYSAAKWAAGPIALADRDPYVGDYPVLAIRSLNYSVCKGGAREPSTRYIKSINDFVSQLGRTYDSPTPYRYYDSAPAPGTHWRPYPQRQAAVILEPDRLGLIGAGKGCLSPTEKVHSLQLMSYAVKKLTSLPNVAVYIDAGEENWLSVDQAVGLLRKAGVGRARGFALNSTHTGTTRANIRYGNQIARRLGGKHFVVNTSENAHGKLPKRIYNHKSRLIPIPGPNNTNCNPPNAGLGTQPTTHTGSSYADALLFISRAGLSSNANDRCGRGPTTNEWYMAHALDIARQASFGQAAWPPNPL